MRKFLIILILSLCGACQFGNAQGIKDIRINEILVKNVDNYMDDYGHRSSWIELHNTGHAKINIGGCYLRIVAGGEETLYRIPTGDSETVIGPLGYLLFFCEGTGTKGTFYTNFTLDNVESVSLLRASGKIEDTIDEVKLDYNGQREDVSIGWFTNRDGKEIFGTLPQTTPNATNNTEPVIPKSERFRELDPSGGMLALLAICIVLTVLTSLFIFFKLLGNYMVGVSKRKNAAAVAAKTVSGTQVSKDYKNPDTGDEIAAIAMALQMFKNELHDKESTVLTINRVARAYSPWSSKIYGLRQFNKK